MLARLNLEVRVILIFIVSIVSIVSHLFVPSLAPLGFPRSVLLGVSRLARSSPFY
jgi:hypothetical protein